MVSLYHRKCKVSKRLGSWLHGCHAVRTPDKLQTTPRSQQNTFDDCWPSASIEFVFYLHCFTKSPLPSCHESILLMRKLRHEKMKEQGHIAIQQQVSDVNTDLTPSLTYSVLASQPSKWWGLLSQWMKLYRQAQGFCMRAHWELTCALWDEEMNRVT